MKDRRVGVGAYGRHAGLELREEVAHDGVVVRKGEDPRVLLTERPRHYRQPEQRQLRQVASAVRHVHVKLGGEDRAR